MAFEFDPNSTKPQQVLGFYKDKSGSTWSGKPRDTDLDKLEALLKHLRSQPYESRDRLAVWPNKYPKDKVPDAFLTHLPPREPASNVVKAMKQAFSDDVDF